MLTSKGVDPKQVEQKIEAKVGRPPRLTKAQHEEVSALQAEIDAEPEGPGQDARKKVWKRMEHERGAVNTCYDAVRV